MNRCKFVVFFFSICLVGICLLHLSGCSPQQLRVTYRSEPPGGTLYKLNGELLGPCPKPLYYDLDAGVIAKGYLDVQGLEIRWPTGPVKRSGEVMRITVDGTNRAVTFVQPNDTQDTLESAVSTDMRRKQPEAFQATELSANEEKSQTQKSGPQETPVKNNRNTSKVSTPPDSGNRFATNKKPKKKRSARDIAQNTFPSVVMLVMQDSGGQPISLGSGFLVKKT